MIFLWSLNFSVIWEGGWSSYYGVGTSESFIKYIFLAVTYFSSFMHSKKNKRLQTVASMVSSGAFERSDNSYKESIVEPCASKNQKEILAVWV